MMTAVVIAYYYNLLSAYVVRVCQTVKHCLILTVVFLVQ